MPIFRSVASIASPSLGGVGTNSWHFRTVGGEIGPTDEESLQNATDALEDFYTSFQARFAGLSLITHDGFWTRIDDESGDTHDVDGWSVGPTSGGNPLPPQDSLVIGWRTSSGGRRGRGRTFIGPLAVSCLQDNGTPEEAARTDLEAGAAALISAFAGLGGGSFVVWSETGQQGRDFVSAAVRNVFGSLRSRRD